MIDDFYTELSECLKNIDVDEVHYNFVEGDIDETKTYVTYSRLSKNADYQASVDSSLMQVSVFSKSLSAVINVRDYIAMHFYGMKKTTCKTEICATNIEDESELYDEANKLHQAIVSIRLLTKKLKRGK